jgi:hypothetical protein
MAQLRSYDRLIGAGFDDAQARAIIDAMSGDLVTREYLDARLADLRADLTRFMIGLVLPLYALIIGLAGGIVFFLLPHVRFG